MRRKIHIWFIIILLFISLNVESQEPSILWVKAYGGNYGWNHGESVVQTRDGGFIVAGYKEVFKAPNSTTSLRDIDRVYVVRTDSTGDTLWTREYGGKSDDRGYSVQQTGDGGFIIVGKTRSFGAGGFDAYLIRIDSIGDTLWTKTYGTVDNEEGWSVDLTSDGGFVIAGWTTHVNPPGYNVYLVRTDSVGDTLWNKTYQDGEAYSVKHTKDKGFIVTGYSVDTANNYDYQLFLIRTDSTGDTLWTKTYGDKDSPEEGRSVQQTIDNGFIISGSKGVGKSDNTYLIRTDSRGDTLWTKMYNLGDITRGNSLEQTGDSGFIVAGCIGGDVLILRTDHKGETLWTKTYGTETLIETGKSVQQTSDGGYIVAGTGRLETDSSGVYMILIRLDKDNTEIQKESTDDFEMIENYTISYDYENNSISINYYIPYSGDVKLEVYDTKGKLVKVIVDKFKNSGIHTVKWDTKKDGGKLIAGGVYFLRLSANDFSTSKKVTILK